jgi:chromatin assembly factor 1 subunit B
MTKFIVKQVFDVSELGPLHATQQHHRQLQAIAQNYSGSFSLPPSPAPMNSLPVAYPARMEREMSTASTGPSSNTASPFITRTELNAGIYGIPVGTASVGKSGSSVTSSVAEDTPSVGLPTKRSQSTDNAETSQKKRKIDLTRATGN